MESCNGNAETSKNCATVPPIVIRGGTPPPTPGSSLVSTNGACILPPIPSQIPSVSDGQLSYNHWSSRRPEILVGDHSRYETVKLEHPGHGQASSCMFSSNYQLPANSKNPPNSIYVKLPNRLSPLTTNNHLQPPVSIQRVPSPLLSDLSPSHNILKSSHSRILHFDPNCFSRTAAKMGRLKPEMRPGLSRLPSLQPGNTSGSNLDIDDTISPILPPINSLSPYIGSGISEIPSFPSILSPMNSAQLSRKRALSTSPLSDMLDVYGIRSSPNSLMATFYNPMTPNGSAPIGSNSTVGYLKTPSNPLQYKVQQRKTAIEHNQSNDGATNATTSNQISFSENMHDMVSETLTKATDGSEPMETDSLNSHRKMVDMNHPHNIKDEDYLDEPHICLWKQCGQNFKDLEDLVQHIENSHIEKGKSDEYICLWQSCIRRQKPFNARYKLLIHMRIHSGEKPNKCTVSFYYNNI